MSDGTGLGESSSVLDFMSMKSYPDMSLDISMLNPLGEYPSIVCTCIHMYLCKHTLIIVTQKHERAAPLLEPDCDNYHSNQS